MPLLPLSTPSSLLLLPSSISRSPLRSVDRALSSGTHPVHIDVFLRVKSLQMSPMHVVHLRPQARRVERARRVCPASALANNASNTLPKPNSTFSHEPDASP
ncbi:hypothetical protein B0H15DRAFT_1022534 [Mycena belliarum]|uniref:Uncharacterized protein n=1 Tax=Mycena belliarum TaxID=1033014 RepID=A0AAD6U735_9AGAR|nr:hypothetical protein B0H15DRAFT_1022534 [Mycena belliae]